MAKAVSSSARFRQRKISVKQTLQVISQSDIPDLEDEQQRELQQIETGVEKGEEEVSLAGKKLILTIAILHIGTPSSSRY